MDAREAQQFRDSIMADVRRLINGKYHPVDDNPTAAGSVVNSNHTNSNQTSQNGAQLNIAITATRDSLAKTNALVLDIQTQLKDLKALADSIKSNADNSTLPRSVASLEAKFVILNRQADPEGVKRSLASVEQSIATLVQKLQVIETSMQTLKLQPILERLAQVESTYKSIQPGQIQTPVAQIATLQPALDQSSVTQSITSLKENLEALNRKVLGYVGYDDSKIIGRIAVAENNIGSISQAIQDIKPFDPTPLLERITDTENSVSSISQSIRDTKPFDPTSLAKLIADTNTKVQELTNITTILKFDPTPLLNRISALEAAQPKPITPQPSPVVFGPLGGIGSSGAPIAAIVPTVASDTSALLKRIDDLETLIKTITEGENNNKISINVIASNAATKGDIEAIGVAFRALESRVLALESRFPPAQPAPIVFGQPQQIH